MGTSTPTGGSILVDSIHMRMFLVLFAGTKAIDQAAASLLRLRDRVDIAMHGAPSRLIVVTATGYAFERPDGVCVVPVTALGP